MGFFGSAITILQTLVVAIGASLGVWGVINLMEGYGNDNPGAKSQGIKAFRRSLHILMDIRRKKRKEKRLLQRLDILFFMGWRDCC